MNAFDDDLDGRLRDLFGHGDFDVATPAGTDTRILAGARRARRRATTVGAVSAVAVVAAAGAAVAAGAGGGGENRVVPASPTPFYCPMYDYYRDADGMARLYTMYATPLPEEPSGTEDPAGDVTDEPTDEPTHEPTGEPVESVTVTEEPTAEVTLEPTGEVTDRPTGEPSSPRNLLPTDRPTPSDPPGCVPATGDGFVYAPPSPAPWETVPPTETR